MKRIFKLRLFIFGILFFGFISANAQDPNRFIKTVEQLDSIEYHFDNNKKLIVFAGSSSIRMWKNVSAYFPLYNVINNGFGGSHFSDLIYFRDKLITKQQPDYLFIYEGDNDIAGEKSPGKVYRDAKKLIKKTKRDLHKTEIIIISPKPSIARWNLHKKYEKLNKKLKKYSEKKKNVKFADVWSAMLDDSGNVYQDIFIEDGLHMNSKGYDIWKKVLIKYLN